MLDSIPNDLLINIACWLDARSVCRLAATCRSTSFIVKKVPLRIIHTPRYHEAIKAWATHPSRRDRVLSTTIKHCARQPLDWISNLINLQTLHVHFCRVPMPLPQLPALRRLHLHQLQPFFLLSEANRIFRLSTLIQPQLKELFVVFTSEWDCLILDSDHEIETLELRGEAASATIKIIPRATRALEIEVYDTMTWPVSQTKLPPDVRLCVDMMEGPFPSLEGVERFDLNLGVGSVPPKAWRIPDARVARYSAESLSVPSDVWKHMPCVTHIEFWGTAAYAIPSVPCGHPAQMISKYFRCSNV